MRAARDNPADAEMPYGNVWTQLCEQILKLASGITVSNIALQERFGGVIVRHARDEGIFAVDRARRQAVRKEFGLGTTDRAIVFVGTPRPHKGIYRIAEALERLGDDRLVFVMIGSFHRCGDQEPDRQIQEGADQVLRQPALEPVAGTGGDGRCGCDPAGPEIADFRIPDPRQADRCAGARPSHIWQAV